MKQSRYERAVRRNAVRVGKNPDRAFAAAKAAVTRSAKKRGVDPVLALRAKKSAFSRASNKDKAARQHGQRAREATEKRTTPGRKVRETRDANRIEQEQIHRRGRGRVVSSLDDLYGYEDYEFYDLETSPDYL